VTATDIGMVALGYGKFVRAEDIVALIPIDDDERGEGRRTFVHVAGLSTPIVASRTERAILADMDRAPNLGRPAGADESRRAPARRERGTRRWRRPVGRLPRREPGRGGPVA
jgi:hypothetical protein